MSKKTSTDVEAAYREGFEDGANCYSESAEPSKYIDSHWQRSRTRVAVQPTAVVEDTEILDWLETTLKGSKWDDCLPSFRPRDPKEYYALAKYVGEDGWTIRRAFLAAKSGAIPPVILR